MPKPKLVALPKKLSPDELAESLTEMKELKAKKKAIEKEYDKIEEKVIETLGIKGVFQYGGLRAKVVQSLRRTVPWRLIALSLARKLYPAEAFGRWLRKLVKDYPKKPTSPFVKLTEKKDEEGE